MCLSPFLIEKEISKNDFLELMDNEQELLRCLELSYKYVQTLKPKPTKGKK